MVWFGAGMLVGYFLGFLLCHWSLRSAERYVQRTVLESRKPRGRRTGGATTPRTTRWQELN